MDGPTLNEVRDSLGGISGVVHDLPPLSTGMSWLLFSSPSAFQREQISNRTCSSNPRIRPTAWRRLPRLGYCCVLSGCFNMRSFLSSPLVFVGKGFKLIGNRSVGHGLGSAEHSLCRF
jgi:hypothetical protein